MHDDAAGGVTPGRAAAPAAGYAGVLEIESVDHEARGVARLDGKVVFVDGALPGERVVASPYRRREKFDNAQLVALRHASPARVAPRCAHFGVCGGCSLQHAEIRTQVAIKQRVLEDNLRHIGRVAPERMLRPIEGPAWGYRQRARLSVRHVPKKGGVLVGFHERRSSYVADMRECHVLPARIAALLMPLRDLVAGLSIRDRVPQVELAVGARVDVLVFRVLLPPSADDEALLRRFAETHGVQAWLQPAGPASARPFWPLDAPALDYELPGFGVRMPFHPTEFTQVNQAVNEVLVTRAVRLVDPQPGEHIADFFCGLGNFTLALARGARAVTGVEGSAGLVERARANAAANGLAARATFHAADLFAPDAAALAAWGRFDKALIDPPREGAVALVKALGAQGAAAPRRIVYVSCNPATLARDAGLLVGEFGYALKAAGAVNMFPHTSHVESIALFERD
ncbi:MAG: 23S rRNA (uracil(1939)-C(5))-methyltransferase RlmD [Burkholderiales bacterium]|nr:23S rRNA (uracil(1939)-C(5))-methyltransferase RlmD [Burkholderiales bacterium]